MAEAEVYIGRLCQMHFRKVLWEEKYQRSRRQKDGDREEKPQNKAARGEEKHCTNAEIVGI